MGYRRAAWLLQQRFHGVLSQSAWQRWVEAMADSLPSAEAISQARNEPQPITEAHGDELCPRGSAACGLVLKAAHGRWIATPEVDTRAEKTVALCLERMQQGGLALQTCYIAGGTAS